MKPKEAKKKNQEMLKLLRKEEKAHKEIGKRVKELRDSLYLESSRLKNEIKGLASKCDYNYVVRIKDSAYIFRDEEFKHGFRQNEFIEFDLYDSIEQIIRPSRKKSHLGFQVGHKVRLKQEGVVQFRYSPGKFDQFKFPAGLDIVEPGASHYVLGVSRPDEVKNPFVSTTILCFYGDGKALVEYSTTRNYFKYYDVVELSNYEDCSHLYWDHKKGIDKSFGNYLKTVGLTEKIEFVDKFGFQVGETIYIKSHEIILENPTIKVEEFERSLGKDLYFMQSFSISRESAHSSGCCVWKVFGFVGDKVLVECHSREFHHFELISPEEIGLLIDLDYRLKKEKYFDRLIYKPNCVGGTYLHGIKKITE